MKSVSERVERTLKRLPGASISIDSFAKGLAGMEPEWSVPAVAK